MKTCFHLWIQLIIAFGKQKKYPVFKLTLTFGIIWIVLYFSGLYVHFIEKDYYTEFSYPLEGDIQKYVQQLMSDIQPDVTPFNFYNYSSIHGKPCVDDDGKPSDIRLLFMVKSAVHHFDRRKAIRKTWGWEKRFSDVSIRCMFILGKVEDKPSLQKRVNDEQKTFGDIIQYDFLDSYFNNTIKTMLGFKWIVTNCSSAKYIMFSDDDMYVSAKNVLRFLRNPKHFPSYLQRNVLESSAKLNLRNIDEEIDHLLAGYVFFVSPQRHIFSKWYISYEEYPYSLFPPYVTAGAYIMSRTVAKKMYFTSMYTKHFRFDDIYVGILAKKAHIDLVHEENIHFWKLAYDKHQYEYVIASHGYSDPQELIKVWNEQRSLGNA